jgi:cell division protein FtsI/penicillin-binding protein 2
MFSFIQARSHKAVLVAMMVLFVALSSFAATVSTRHESRSSRRIKESASTERRMAATRHSRAVRRGRSGAAAVAGTRGRRRARYYERFTASSFSSDPAAGDVTAGEDPVVRLAAVDALGNMNGTVVAIDPANGRVLAMVNQKLALSGGAEPCSTIKVSVALAALSEGIVTKDTPVDLGGWKLDMNQALAHSNNQYFEALGRRLGFQKVSYYAHQFGLGELAGWNIEGEHLGVYPSEELPARLGGVGKMCSFGESVSMTPLQLGSLMAAIANGGTMYYLQHPRSATEVTNFQPKVKRYLDIAPLIPEVRVGMLGATTYGTARSLRQNFTSEQVFGKTGTCSNAGTRFGWFGSFTNSPSGRIVAVIFLQGNRSVYGPRAAELAGHFYRNLDEHNYFAVKAAQRNAALLK